MKYTLQCPKCQSTSISRRIIGAEMETVCENCGYYNATDYFRIKVK